MRLFTLQLLTKLDEDSVFALLLRIESITPSIETYREKLQLLQKLECNEQFLEENRGNELAQMATLKFLFGNLYINFRYLWEPIQKLIVSHLGSGTSAWSILEYQLREAIQCDVNCARLMENLSVDFEGKI